MLFSTGYMANLGVLSALAGKQRPIIQDKLNHASMVDDAHGLGCIGENGKGSLSLSGLNSTR
ncbi:hypothetical protein ABFY09_01805 [Marinomonas sp. 5E14-1]|uniref:hypothetical protein n=1 Tax=Marinomonas sp. 5E14-1 TaxID=3153922 RepID=UPI00326799C4